MSTQAAKKFWFWAEMYNMLPLLTAVVVMGTFALFFYAFDAYSVWICAVPGLILLVLWVYAANQIVFCPHCATRLK